MYVHVASSYVIPKKSTRLNMNALDNVGYGHGSKKYVPPVTSSYSMGAMEVQKRSTVHSSSVGMGGVGGTRSTFSGTTRLGNVRNAASMAMPDQAPSIPSPVKFGVPISVKEGIQCTGGM
jgi:hypothetical protein